MPLNAEAQAVVDQQAKDAEAATAAYEEQVKAEEEAAAKMAESGGGKFIVSVSGIATVDEALDAFDAFIAGFDTINGSIVVGGISHDVSEFKEEEAAPAPTPMTTKTSTSGSK